LARLRFLEGRPEAERGQRLAIAREIQSSGGMTAYLGFDDPTYLDRLTRSWDWSSDGPALLDRLLLYRHTHGRPAPELTRPT
jgi:hypothetical protein